MNPAFVVNYEKCATDIDLSRIIEIAIFQNIKLLNSYTSHFPFPNTQLRTRACALFWNSVTTNKDRCGDINHKKLLNKDG